MQLGELPARKLTTPERDRLTGGYAKIEQTSRVILALEAIAVVVIAWWIYQRPGSLSPALAWFVGLAGGLGLFHPFVRGYFLKKKRLHELREDVRFGVHTRDSLIALVDRVFERLGLPPNACPVFVIRAKDVNASAIRCELLPGLHFANGIFLNRSIIHLLDEAELESVVGHELGHVFPYAPVLSRCYLLHAALGAAGSLLVAPIFADWGFGPLAPAPVLWVIERIIAYPWIQLGRGIEFLCDDFGARAAGVLPALSAEMKMNADGDGGEAERITDIDQTAIRSVRDSGALRQQRSGNGPEGTAKAARSGDAAEQWTIRLGILGVSERKQQHGAGGCLAGRSGQTESVRGVAVDHSGPHAMAKGISYVG